MLPPRTQKEEASDGRNSPRRAELRRFPLDARAAGLPQKLIERALPYDRGAKDEFRFGENG
jgi:hypothetical protein